jgi:hypothetical protein
MWRIYLIEWNDSENAKILETKSDIDSFKADDRITVSIARPTNSDHIVILIHSKQMIRLL